MIFSIMIPPLSGRSASCLIHGQGPERYGRKRLGCSALYGILGKENGPVIVGKRIGRALHKEVFDNMHRRYFVSVTEFHTLTDALAPELKIS